MKHLPLRRYGRLVAVLLSAFLSVAHPADAADDLEGPHEADQLQKWAAKVDQLVKDTRNACLKAKDSDDLDGVMFRCSTVQMEANRGNNVMNERLNHKLQGVVQTLSAWTSYLDYQKAGDSQRANNILHGLITNNSAPYPVLTIEEIQSHVVGAADAQMDIFTAMAKAFDGINSPDDLPTALHRFETFSSNPFNQQLNILRVEVSRVAACMDAWKSAQAGDAAAAVATLWRTNFGNDDAQRYYAPVRGQIEARILKDKTAAWTKLTQNPGESTQAYLGRILDEMKKRGEFSTMLDVMAFAGQLDRTGNGLLLTTDRQAIEQYLAGQRFEKIGDGLAAITNYRLVVGLPAGKYSPTEEAQTALQNLQVKYPEAFKNYEGVLSEQIRSLGEMIRMLPATRGAGVPYIPGRP